MKKKLLTFSLLSLLAVGLGTSTASAETPKERAIGEKIVQNLKNGKTIDDLID
ncbi:hypothetical protein ACVRW4_08595 [Streptococcus phocae subsp. phocae]